MVGAGFVHFFKQRFLNASLSCHNVVRCSISVRIAGTIAVQALFSLFESGSITAKYRVGGVYFGQKFL